GEKESLIAYRGWVFARTKAIAQQISEMAAPHLAHSHLISYPTGRIRKHSGEICGDQRYRSGGKRPVEFGGLGAADFCAALEHWVHWREVRPALRRAVHAAAA